MIYDAPHLLDEVRHARRKLKGRCEGVAQMVEQMAAGLSLSKRGDAATRNIENHYFEVIATLGARIAGGEPRVEVVTPRAGEARVEAAAGEAAVNQWVQDTRHMNLLRRLSVDYLIGWGVVGLRLDRLPGQESDDYHTVPVGFRLEREDAYWDVLATEWESRKWAGYQWSIGQDDLIERAHTEKDWDLDAVLNTPTDVDDDDMPATRDGDAPLRREVTVREIWVPRVLDSKAPKWATGTIFTMGAGSPRFLRPPRPFFGPPWGPIYCFDAYYIPGQPLGGGPCEFVREQVEELNRHADALSRAANRRKKIAIGSLFKAEDAKSVRNAVDGEMVLLDGFDKSKYAEFELDGPTDTQVNIVQIMRDRLARTSGMDDPQRGAVTGDATATENAIAAEASGVRTGELSARFAACDELLLSGVLWYVMHTRSLRVKLRPEEAGIPPEMAQNVELTVKGGMRPGLGWSDFKLRVERRTVGRESDAARRQRQGSAVAQFTALARVAPSIAPFADVEMFAKILAEASGEPDLARSISGDKAAEMMGAQMDAEAEGGDVESEMAPDAETQRPAIVPGRRRTEAASAGGMK